MISFMNAVAPSIEARSLDLVRDLVLDHLRDEDVAVYLFGSRARGTAHRGSDIDVGVMPRASISRGCLASLRERLEELPVPYRVELVDLSEASAALSDSALEEAITWRP